VTLANPWIAERVAGGFVAFLFAARWISVMTEDRPDSDVRTWTERRIHFPACGTVRSSGVIFGGFLVTQRMLAMYKKKDRAS